MATSSARMESAGGGTLGARKTVIIMVTVVGCIAILWPKVFYPMVVGPGQTKTVIKDHRGPGCCDVVLDQESFANTSINYANQQNLFRKRNVGPMAEESSIRQERPPHLRSESVHPAMRERGRAISHAGTVQSDRPKSAPRIVEGRPGPIPGMRPPMGAGSHQTAKSANSMGFIMPLYTIGIVSFFIYTILKLIFKKTPTAPYPEIKPDPAFRNEVFTTDQYIKRPDSGKTKLGLISAADEQLMKIDSIKKSASNLSKETEEPDSPKVADPPVEANGHVAKANESGVSDVIAPSKTAQQESASSSFADPEATENAERQDDDLQVTAKKMDPTDDRSTFKVIPMEKKAAYDSSSRPTSPVQSVILDSSTIDRDAAESKCILLDPKVPQTSKVLVADSELAVETLDASLTKPEEDSPFDLNLIVVFESVSNLNRSVELNVLLGSEPATVVRPSAAARVASPTREVVLSGKMKLSLVKLDDNDKKTTDGVTQNTKHASVKRAETAPDGSLGPNEE